MKPATATTRTRILAAFGRAPESPATLADLATLGEAITRELAQFLTLGPDRFVPKTELMRILGVRHEALNNAIRKCNLKGIRFESTTRYPLHETVRTLREHFAA